MRISVIGVWLILMALGNQLSAQDVQFSQFYANPVYLNPALTGSHSGTYRVMANYRDQWRGTIEQPFTTISASGDLKFELPNGGSYQKGTDRVAVGVQFYSDRVGVVEYNTNHLSLTGAYHKKVGDAQYLSGGLQFGIGQRGINYANLNLGDEFDGATGYNLQQHCVYGHGTWAALFVYS